MILNKIILIGIGVIIGVIFSGIILRHNVRYEKTGQDTKIAKLDNAGTTDRVYQKKVETDQKIITSNKKAESEGTTPLYNFNNKVSCKNISYKGTEKKMREQVILNNNPGAALTEQTESRQIAEENKPDETKTKESPENETKTQYVLILDARPKTYTNTYTADNNFPAGTPNNWSQNTLSNKSAINSKSGANNGSLSNNDFNNYPEVPIFGDTSDEFIAENTPPESVPDIPQLPNINSETDNREGNNYSLSDTYPLPELPSNI